VTPSLLVQQQLPACCHHQSLSTFAKRQSSTMRHRLMVAWLQQLQLLVAVATSATDRHDNYTSPSVINVGLLQPLEGPFGFERTGSAATMAVRDAQQRGFLNNTDVRYSQIRIRYFVSCNLSDSVANGTSLCILLDILFHLHL